MKPYIFQFHVTGAGQAVEGQGVLACYVPATAASQAVVVIANDPCHDPGRPIDDMLAAAVAHVGSQLPRAELAEAYWAAVDAWGRFGRVVVEKPRNAEDVRKVRKPATWRNVDAFLHDTGPAGDTALEMLSSVIEAPSMQQDVPSAEEFLNAVEFHGNLPAPGALSQRVDKVVAEGDVRKVAHVIRTDPVMSSTLISYANSARFAVTAKTSSLLEAVQRLGIDFTRRIVFVAAMMQRYQKGQCAEFDYRGYWMNALATAVAMQTLMPAYGIPEAMKDDAFVIGLVSGIGWLAVAETYPGLMAKYLRSYREADALTKVRAQKDIFPCPIRKVSERYLERFAFPEVVQATVAGKDSGHSRWSDCLARAVRAASRLHAFDCLAVLPLAELPSGCEAAWAEWRGLFDSPSAKSP